MLDLRQSAGLARNPESFSTLPRLAQAIVDHPLVVMAPVSFLSAHSAKLSRHVRKAIEIISTGIGPGAYMGASGTYPASQAIQSCAKLILSGSDAIPDDTLRAVEDQTTLHCICWMDEGTPDMPRFRPILAPWLHSLSKQLLEAELIDQPTDTQPAASLAAAARSVGKGKGKGKRGRRRRRKLASAPAAEEAPFPSECAQGTELPPAATEPDTTACIPELASVDVARELERQEGGSGPFSAGPLSAEELESLSRGLYPASMSLRVSNRIAESNPVWAMHFQRITGWTRSGNVDVTPERATHMMQAVICMSASCQLMNGELREKPVEDRALTLCAAAYARRAFDTLASAIESGVGVERKHLQDLVMMMQFVQKFISFTSRTVASDPIDGPVRDRTEELDNDDLEHEIDVQMLVIRRSLYRWLVRVGLLDAMRGLARGCRDKERMQPIVR